MIALELLLRGVAAGALLACAVGIYRGNTTPLLRRSGIGCCLAVAAFSVHSGGADTQAVSLIGPLVWLLSAGGAGYLWLFATSLFADRSFHWLRLLPIVVLTAVAGLAVLSEGRIAEAIWIAHNLLEVSLMVHVLAVVLMTWRNDLVEFRRSLRGPMVGLSAFYAVLLAGLEIADAMGRPVAWENLFQGVTLACLALFAAFALLESRRDLTPPVVSPPLPAAKDKHFIAQLESAMSRDDVWRREGLTIGQLAAEVGLPEHRVRRLINDNLGFRNFSDFLNAKRIAAAKLSLSDPTRAKVAIATLAFELGYNSLAPFQRAFKEQVGTTPSQFRAQALSAQSPVPNSIEFKQ